MFLGRRAPVHVPAFEDPGPDPNRDARLPLAKSE